MINLNMLLATVLLMSSCAKDSVEIAKVESTENSHITVLPLREGERPATTSGIPHVQLDLDLVPTVHEEMIRRIYSIEGIKDKPSAILSWQGLFLESNIQIANPESLISGREFGHIHDDGSLHIFLEAGRADEAIEKGWAVSHPYAVEGRSGWNGFVMLYTPQTIEELNVVFQLIVDAFNHVAGQDLRATDFY